MVGNPPDNAGDMGSSPGPGGSHKLRGNWAGTPQLLSLRSRAREPQLLKPVHLEPMLHNGGGHCSERPAHHRPPLATIRERPAGSNEDPMQPKIK